MPRCTPPVAGAGAAPDSANSEGVGQWFAVFTMPRHEKRLAAHFAQRRIEHFLPLYSTQRRWNDGSRVTLELPLFPNYIFVRVCRAQRSQVLRVPGALKFVCGPRSEPATLSDSELETLRSGLHEGAAEPCALLPIGQRVRIIRGPLAGMEGVVQRSNNKPRVVLTLNLIMQSVAVQVDSDDLEPANSDAARISGPCSHRN